MTSVRDYISVADLHDISHRPERFSKGIGGAVKDFVAGWKAMGPPPKQPHVATAAPGASTMVRVNAHAAPSSNATGATTAGAAPFTCTKHGTYSSAKDHATDAPACPQGGGVAGNPIPMGPKTAPSPPKASGAGTPVASKKKVVGSVSVPVAGPAGGQVAPAVDSPPAGPAPAPVAAATPMPAAAKTAAAENGGTPVKVRKPRTQMGIATAAGHFPGDEETAGKVNKGDAMRAYAAKKAKKSLAKGGIRKAMAGMNCRGCAKPMKPVAHYAGQVTHMQCENPHCDNNGVAVNVQPRSAEVNAAAASQIRNARANKMGHL